MLQRKILTISARFVPAACAFAAAASCATDPLERLPDKVSACESHTGTVCSTWTRTSDGYHAVYDQGTQANLAVERFDADSIVIHRVDRMPNPAPFTTATYRAAPDGRAVRNGVVTFRQSGVVFSGRWQAEW